MDALMSALTLLGYRKNGQPIYLARGGSEEPPVVVEDPTAAELAALRKEKADREAAERADEKAELAELREFKEKASKAPVVKAPTPKAEKEVKTEDTPPPATKKAGRGGAARSWFGDA
jgi:hypothetical protein